MDPAEKNPLKPDDTVVGLSAFDPKEQPQLMDPNSDPSAQNEPKQEEDSKPSIPSVEHTVISEDPPLVPTEKNLLEASNAEFQHQLVGTELDHFRLDAFVGAGGMGAVFRATDTQLNRTVAVKVLAPQYALDSETRVRFENEARSTARLDHPNIAQVHFVSEDRGIPYIVFEFIEGDNLRDRVYANGTFSVEEALPILLQIADALTHAWRRGVVHRDIKPANIILTADSQTKIVDMGLARLQQVEEVEDLTRTGVTLGTFDYISPEQARNPREADVRSDIYSLGCTLFFMLCRQPPFPGGTALQKLLQHQDEKPPRLAEFRADIPEQVQGLLDQMLAKRPLDRMQTPEILASEIIQVCDSLELSHPRLFSPITVIPMVSPWRIFLRVVPGAASAFLLAFAVFAIAKTYPQPTPGHQALEISQVKPLAFGENQSLEQEESLLPRKLTSSFSENKKNGELPSTGFSSFTFPNSSLPYSSDYFFQNPIFQQESLSENLPWVFDKENGFRPLKKNEPPTATASQNTTVVTTEENPKSEQPALNPDYYSPALKQITQFWEGIKKTYQESKEEAR